MAYVPATAAPYILVQDVNGNNKIWRYDSVDAAALVRVAGYFTDGWKRGMRAGDLIYVTDTDASPPIVTAHRINAASATSVDLTDADTAVTGTDSD